MNSYVPSQIAKWLSELPSENIGQFYAWVRPPGLFAHARTKKIKVEAWGQLCAGTDNRRLVHLTLYNTFPKHGKGWTYVSWESVPDNPEANKHPRAGVVQDPQPYDGGCP